MGEVSDDEHVDAMCWMIDHYQDLFASVRLENLRPDLYPEHEVLAAFIRRRDGIRARLRRALDHSGEEIED